jgi:hypothetical protein
MIKDSVLGKHCYRDAAGMPIRGLRYIGMGKASAMLAYYQKQILRITLRMTISGIYYGE